MWHSRRSASTCSASSPKPIFYLCSCNRCRVSIPTRCPTTSAPQNSHHREDPIIVIVGRPNCRGGLPFSKSLTVMRGVPSWSARWSGSRPSTSNSCVTLNHRASQLAGATHLVLQEVGQSGGGGVGTVGSPDRVRLRRPGIEYGLREHVGTALTAVDPDAHARWNGSSPSLFILEALSGSSSSRNWTISMLESPLDASWIAGMPPPVDAARLSGHASIKKYSRVSRRSP